MKKTLMDLISEYLYSSISYSVVLNSQIQIMQEYFSHKCENFNLDEQNHTLKSVKYAVAYILVIL